MRTLCLEEPGRWAWLDLAKPEAPGPGEALVRIRRCGVCGTDLHAFRGRQPFFSYPRILGHELGVEVVAVGEGVTDLAPGDRCAVEPYLNCNHCIACLRGKPNCCVSLRVLGVHVDGGMREWFIVPAKKLHRANHLSFDQLALIETLCIGAHAVERARIDNTDNVLVIGAGPIGLGVMQFAMAAGAHVTAMDLSEERLNFCQQHWGVPSALKPEAVDEAASSEPFTAVFDATGNPASMAGAFDRTCAGGRLTFVGLFQGDLSFHDPDFHRRELTVLASRNAKPEDFVRVIELIASGRLNTDAWITHRAPLAAVPETFATWLDPDSRCLKAIIEVS